MKEFKLIRWSIPTLILAALIQTGCATGNAVKQQIAKDLNEIVEYQDCPTICEAVKTYIKTRLAAE